MTDNISDEEVALQLASLHGKLSSTENQASTKEADAAMYGARRLLGVDEE